MIHWLCVLSGHTGETGRLGANRMRCVPGLLEAPETSARAPSGDPTLTNISQRAAMCTTRYNVTDKNLSFLQKFRFEYKWILNHQPSLAADSERTMLPG